MTLEDLNAHLIIIQELEAAREALAALETATLTASRLDTMLHAAGQGDRTAALAVKIAEQREVVLKYERMVEASSIIVKAWIDTICDNRTNLIFYLRFICGYEWQDVAEVIGGKNTENAVKSQCYRYLAHKAAERVYEPFPGSGSEIPEIQQTRSESVATGIDTKEAGH